MLKICLSQFVNQDIETFSPVKNTPVQIGFHSLKLFESYPHRELFEKCREQNSEIVSVHAPSVDIFDGDKLFKTLQMIKNAYEVDNVTIHPGAGCPMKGLKLHRLNQSIFEELGMYLMYENFDSSKKNRRWLPNARMIYKTPLDYTLLTYDTSHVSPATDLVSEVKEFLPRLGMIHLSNKLGSQNHRPIFDGTPRLEGLLKYLRDTNYPGYIVLEYAPIFKDSLLKDYETLKAYFKVH